MDKTLKVNRSEMKYIMHPIDTMRLKEELDILLHRDEHSQEGSYMVRSLYFDSLNDIDFMGKDAGNEKRKKVRIRVYEPNASKGKFEIKQKVGSYSCKKSLTISKDEIVLAQDGNYSFLLDYESEVATELYSILTMGCYRPKSIIEYQREAFTFPENNIRVTLDSNILAEERELDLLENNPNYMPIMCDNIILEVKFDSSLVKTVSDILKKYNLTQISFGKYVAGRPIYEKYII